MNNVAPTAFRPPSLAVLVAITTLNPLALNILQPALPELARAFATDYGTIQLTLSLYLVGSAVAQIGLGPISDKLGRRPVALVGLAVFVGGSLACVFATSVATLVLGRIVQAIGGVAGFVIARAVLRDLYGREAAASRLGYVIMAMVVVPMVAPLIGGWLAEWSGYEGVFIFTSTLGIAALIFAVADLRETRRRGESDAAVSIGAAYRALLQSPAFLAHALTMCFTSATFFTFLAGAPYVLVELQGRGPSAFGLWFMVASVPFMAGNFLAGRLAERIGTRRIVGIGTVLPIAGLILLFAGYYWQPAEPAVLFIATIPCWIGSGMTLPAAVASALSVRPDLAGAASGLSGALQFAGGSVSAYVVAAALGATAWPMIVVMGLTSLAALAAHLVARRADAGWQHHDHARPAA